MKMKALNDIEKDKLIIKSIINDDFYNLFSNLSKDFSNDLIHIKGYAQKWNLSYENIKKYYKLELKNILNENDYKQMIIFFDSISDKIELCEEKNIGIYLSTFLFRFLFNMFHLSGNTIEENINNLFKEYDKDHDELLFNKSSISYVKSSISENDDRAQSFLIVISELFYYIIDHKYNNDIYREMVTHGITGCFLLEDFNLNKLNLLIDNYKLSKLFEMYQIK